MNPMDVAHRLRNAYLEYLQTSFGVSREMADLRDRFVSLLEKPGRLLAGPYLEATPSYVSSGKSLGDLVEEGVLSSGMKILFAPKKKVSTSATIPGGRGFRLGRPTAVGDRPDDAGKVSMRLNREQRLYLHQEKAIRQLCLGENLLEKLPHTVVASGTGSGKTECFLLPILDWIFRHPTRGFNGESRGRGIRALIVYPMNALVNDQIRRLRSIVGSWEGQDEAWIPITFGRYTSETATKAEEARDKEPQAPLNQVLSRDEIIASPPDILITNFAMLEQALLRPQENPLFSVVDDWAWRFLVLDEAHSYRGAQGIELARLMQRVRAAIRREKTARGLPSVDPICIATSATLSSGQADEPTRREETAEFASSLFGVSIAKDRVIFASRVNPFEEGGTWEFAKPEEQGRAIQALANLGEGWLTSLDQPLDEVFLHKLRELVPNSIWEDAKASCNGERRSFLFYLFRSHPLVLQLWHLLREHPQPFESLVERMGPGNDTDFSVPLEQLVNLCNAARRCEGEQSLLPCRYHMFASSLEGLFVELATDEELKQASDDWDVPSLGIRVLDVRRLFAEDRFPFEVSRCSRCHFPFLSLDSSDDNVELDQPPVWQRKTAFYSFHSMSSAETKTALAEVDMTRVVDASPAGDRQRKIRTLYEVAGNQEGTDVQSCPHCGLQSRYQQVAYRYQTGQDTPVSVLVEAFYSQLPGLTVMQRDALRNEYVHRHGAQGDPMVGGGRKLLIFSDSRQNAAFMASYLQDRASVALLRRAAYRAILKQNGDSMTVAEWTQAAMEELQFFDLHLPFLKNRDWADVPGEPFRHSYHASTAERRLAITESLLEELVGQTTESLEAHGMIKIRLPKQLHDIFLESGLTAVLYSTKCGASITAQDLLDLTLRNVALMRRRFQLSSPMGCEPFGFGTVPQKLVWSIPSTNPSNAWTAMRNAANRDNLFSDLVDRWLTRRASKSSSEETRQASKLDIMKQWFDMVTSDNHFQCCFEVANEGGVQTLQVKWDGIEVEVPNQFYKCSICGAWSTVYFAGVCPTSYCPGELRTVDRPARDEDNGSERPSSIGAELNENLQCFEMRVEEHTAQLSSDFGQQVQEAFQAGQVNVLSCSTTFEMGIDIGALQAVVLRNVPPGTANYLQRAGRAGRRADSVAFVLTFCQRRPHDRLCFSNPLRILAGPISPPKIDLENRKILQRHCNAEVLSEYWNWLNHQLIQGKDGQFATGGDIGRFFQNRLDRVGLTPYEHLPHWMKEEPNRNRCMMRMREAFPRYDDSVFWGFLDLLMNSDPNSGNSLAVASQEVLVLAKTYTDGREKAKQAESQNDVLVSRFRESGNLHQSNEASKERRANASLKSAFERLSMQHSSEYLISYLMSRGVLPSFAFPVNVLQLHVLKQEFSESIDRNSIPRFKFDRDGRIALGEYAPGAEVIAGKRIYRSIGLRKFPAQEFDLTTWVRLCNKCGAIQVWPGDPDNRDQPKQECRYCGELFGHNKPRPWISPKWGFVTDVKADSKLPRGQRPTRIMSTRSFFIRMESEGPSEDVASAGTWRSSKPVQGHYAAGRSLLVLNLGEFKLDSRQTPQRSGYLVCRTCGRAEFHGQERPHRHRPPYHRFGQYCSGPVGIGDELGNRSNEPVWLGHRYETDVLMLDFRDDIAASEGLGVWMSLGYAILHGACSVLDIERQDLDMTAVPQKDGRYQLVIYDTVPGGAGHCRQILDGLGQILRRSLELLAGCDCDPNSFGCFGCLADYRNQFVHQHLSRGGAMKVLERIVDSWDTGVTSPWRWESASPAREIYQSLNQSPGDVEIVVPRISTEYITSIAKDWFDVLKHRVSNPSNSRSKVRVCIAELPKGSDKSEDLLAQHRLSELSSRGIVFEELIDKDRTEAYIAVRSSFEQKIRIETVWRWPWRYGLEPDLAQAQQSRIGCEFQAEKTLQPCGRTRPIELRRFREFGSFTLEPGIQHNFHAPKILGRILCFTVDEIVIIDPHVFHSDGHVASLNRFIQQVRWADKSRLTIKTSYVRNEERSQDYSPDKQRSEVDKFTKKFEKHSARVTFPPRGKMVDHDRILYLETTNGDETKYFKVLLGQGLFGFEPICRRRSNGVWFPIDQSEWETRLRD